MIRLKNKQIYHHITRLHFIGIGGVGMSGIAEVLHNLGYIISGSDQKASVITKHLSQIGCIIYQGHLASQVKEAQAVVISSAIKENNKELIFAKQNNIPIVARAEMLSELMRFRYGIAIAGTHGKTTTTSLITHILAEAKLDPTYIIGGILNSSGVNAKLGQGDYLVAEADESDSSFLHLQPMLSVITNIDEDHMATYQYNLQKLEQSFLRFIGNLPFYGTCIVCLDDKGVQRIKNRINRPLITYGFDKKADIQASHFKQIGTQMTYQVNIKKQQQTIDIQANLIGRHNVLNMLAAISTALSINISLVIIIKALSNFQGVSRRLQCHNQLIINKKIITYFDDYGHHPSEIQAVISGLRDSYTERLVVIFQPHRYSRTKDLFDAFVQVLAQVDMLILLDIYPANEIPLNNITSTTLAHAIGNLHKVRPIVLHQGIEVFNILPDIIKNNDVLLTLGAGNIDQLSKQLIAQYLPKKSPD